MNARLSYSQLERLIEILEQNKNYDEMNLRLYMALCPLYNEAKRCKYNSLIIVEGGLKNEN